VNNNKTRRILLSASIILLFCFSFCGYASGIAPNNINVYESTAEHALRIYDFSHYMQPIYVNYTVANMTVMFLSSEINTAVIEGHYSVDGINWTTVAFTKIGVLLDSDEQPTNKALFNTSLGPFVEAGEYQLKINATSGFTEYAASYIRFTVIEVEGIVFLDLSYSVKLSDQDQFIDVEVVVLGDDIKLGSVSLATDQEEHNETETMNLKAGTNHTYWAILGPSNTWDKIIRVTFSANTSDDTQYTNDNFFILKQIVNPPEKFWSSKFPAILVGAVFVILVFTIYIMNKRKTPRRYDV
jgi:hypothetical protein